MAQLVPLSLTVSCFSEIQIGFTFLVLAHPRSPRKRAVKRVCVCVCVLDLGHLQSRVVSGEPLSLGLSHLSHYVDVIQSH